MASRQVWAYTGDAQYIKSLQGTDGLTSSMDVISHLIASKRIADLPRYDWCKWCEDTYRSEVKEIREDGSYTTECHQCGHQTNHGGTRNE